LSKEFLKKPFSYIVFSRYLSFPSTSRRHLVKQFFSAFLVAGTLTTKRSFQGVPLYDKA
jgi:hypothetical protein